MAKKIKLNWRDLGLVAVAAFAWSKLGVGETVKDIGVFRREYPSKFEVGYMTQAAWQLKYGGSQLDYQDWVKGV